MCLRAQGIDDNDVGVGRVRRGCGISDNDGGVGRGRGICDVSKALETATESTGDRRRAQGIYNDDGGIGGGRLARRLQQRQRRRWRRIDDTSKESETMTEAAVDRRQARWIGNYNGVLISLSIGFLTLTLYRLCLVTVSFRFFFIRFLFFVRCKKYYQYCNHAENIFVPSVH